MRQLEVTQTGAVRPPRHVGARRSINGAIYVRVGGRRKRIGLWTVYDKDPKYDENEFGGTFLYDRRHCPLGVTDEELPLVQRKVMSLMLKAGLAVSKAFTDGTVPEITK